MAEETWNICSFDGGEMKEILPVLEKHFSFAIEDIWGLLSWCDKEFYHGKATLKQKDENGVTHASLQPEFFIEGNKKIYIPFPCPMYDNIINFLQDNSHLSDKQTTILGLMFYVYSESPFEPDWFELLGDYNYFTFHEFVRPDMLRLFKFLHDTCPSFSSWREDYKKHPTWRDTDVSSEPSKSITISYGKHAITLNNTSNWFLQHLTEYITRHLKEDSIEEVDEELKAYKTKVGAKPERDLNRIVTQLYHFLQEETSYCSPEGKITDNICVFIARFLEILEFLVIAPPEEEFNIPKEEAKKKKILKDWIVYIRSRITDNLKREKIHGAYKSKRKEFYEHASVRLDNASSLSMEKWHPIYW